MADANQQGRDIRGGKGILYAKDEYSSRGQHSYKFPQVSRRKTPGHMLQNDVAVDEREAGVREGQLFPGIRQVAAMCIPVQRPGLVNHLPRNIHAYTRGKARRQGLRYPANAAAKVQRFAGVIGDAANTGEMMHDGLYLGVPSGHKLRHIPFATCPAVVGENGEKGIALSQRFPIVFKPLEIHHAFLRIPVTEPRAGAPRR